MTTAMEKTSTTTTNNNGSNTSKSNSTNCNNNNDNNATTTASNNTNNNNNSNKNNRRSISAASILRNTAAASFLRKKLQRPNELTKNNSINKNNNNNNSKNNNNHVSSKTCVDNSSGDCYKSWSATTGSTGSVAAGRFSALKNNVRSSASTTTNGGGSANNSSDFVNGSIVRNSGYTNECATYRNLDRSMQTSGFCLQKLYEAVDQQQPVTDTLKASPTKGKTCSPAARPLTLPVIGQLSSPTAGATDPECDLNRKTPVLTEEEKISKDEQIRNEEAVLRKEFEWMLNREVRTALIQLRNILSHCVEKFPRPLPDLLSSSEGCGSRTSNFSSNETTSGDSNGLVDRPKISGQSLLPSSLKSSSSTSSWIAPCASFKSKTTKSVTIVVDDKSAADATKKRATASASLNNSCTGSSCCISEATTTPAVAVTATASGAVTGTTATATAGAARICNSGKASTSSFNSILNCSNNSSNHSGASKSEKQYVLIGNPMDKFKTILTMVGIDIVEADIQFKVYRRQNHGVTYHTFIKNDHPWKLQQLQDAVNYLQLASMHLDDMLKVCPEFCSSNEVLQYLEHILSCLLHAKTSLMVPRKYSDEELIKSKGSKFLFPPLPDDLVLNFYIKSPKLVLLVHQLNAIGSAATSKSSRKKPDTAIENSASYSSSVSAYECTIPWINDVLVMYDIGLQVGQQLKDKVAVFAQFNNLNMSARKKYNTPAISVSI